MFCLGKQKPRAEIRRVKDQPSEPSAQSYLGEVGSEHGASVALGTLRWGGVWREEERPFGRGTPLPGTPCHHLYVLIAHLSHTQLSSNTLATAQRRYAAQPTALVLGRVTVPIS